MADRPGTLRIPRPARGRPSVSARTVPQSADLQSPDSLCVVVVKDGNAVQCVAQVRRKVPAVKRSAHRWSGGIAVPSSRREQVLTGMEDYCRR